MDAQLECFCLDDLGRPLPKHRYRNHTKINGISIVDFMRFQISTHLHSHIPSRFPRVRSGHKRPNQYASYLLCLDMVAKPFRLMDLPAELRTRIFSYVIPPRGEVTWSICLNRSLRRKRLHPITRTSRQLRNESLQLAWSQVNLWVGDYDSERMLQLKIFASSIHNFVQPFGPVCIQQLRLATLDIRIRRNDGGTAILPLRLRYSPSKGLEVEPWNSKFFALTPASSERLEVHTKNVSRLFKSLGQHGEALITALTCDPDLWRKGALQCNVRIDP